MKKLTRFLLTNCVALLPLFSGNAYGELTTGPCSVIVTLVKQTNVKCHGGKGGSAEVSASGGIAPFTYVWSPSGGTNATATGLAAGTYKVVATDKNGCKDSLTVTITQPPALKDSVISETNVTCKGSKTGSAAVTASGGTTPYTYAWNPGGNTTSSVTALSAGTYTIEVIDSNGCKDSTKVTIKQPKTALTVKTTLIDSASCGKDNGEASATVSGGWSVYTYSWSPSGGTTLVASNIGAGTYTITVTDSGGCTVKGTIKVPDITTLKDSITSITEVKPCNGDKTGSATGIATGGTAPYTYSWAPSGGTSATATGLAAGVYTLTVTDSKGCSASVKAKILQPTALSDSISSHTNVACIGGTTGSAVVGVSGGVKPYTYAWSNGETSAKATGLSAGTYTVVITDSYGCTDSTTVKILQPATSIRDSIVSSTDVSCYGDSNGSARVGVKGGTPPYTYAWTPSGGTKATATDLKAGTYIVSVYDKNGCGPDTASVKITQPGQLKGTVTQTNVSCYGDSNGAAKVTVSGGTTPYTYSWSPSGGKGATAKGLKAGTYIVTVNDKNHCGPIMDTVIITQPKALRDSIASIVDVSCNGESNGSATAGVKGGTSPYIYSWSPSGGSSATASNLPAGIYTVTITDANKCANTASATITQPTAMSSITSYTPTVCGNKTGAAGVSVSGGTPPYTYMWSPTGRTNDTIDNIGAGTYTCTVTDANKCTYSTGIVIPNSNGPTVSLTSSSNETCYNGSTGNAVISASGGTSPYTYSWSPSGGTSSSASNLSAGTYYCKITDNNGCIGTDSVTITQPALLQASVTSHTNVTCNGGTNGSAAVTASGGTPGYTYSWSPSGGTSSSIAALTAGTYTISINDKNSCGPVTDTVVITQPSKLVDSLLYSVNATCFGVNNGSAAVSVSGGTLPYTYAWSPSGGSLASANNLAAGNYTVNVNDANLCGPVTYSISISQPSSIKDSIASLNNVTCYGVNNGAAILGVTGGTAPYSYSWSPSGGSNYFAYNLAAGTYSVSITDANSCGPVVDTLTITQPSLLTDSIIYFTDIECSGVDIGSAEIGASGGTQPYTYSWQPSGGTNATAGNLAAGTYTATVTDSNGCTNSSVVTISSLDTPISITIDTGTGKVNCADTIFANVSGGTPPYSYLWSPNGQTTDTLTGVCPGTYTVTVTDNYGCQNENYITVTLTVGIPTYSDAIVFKVFPNPASQYLNVSFANSNINSLQYLYIYDITGRQIEEQKINPSSGLIKVNIENLEDGIYMLKLTDGNYNKITKFSVVKY